MHVSGVGLVGVESEILVGAGRGEELSALERPGLDTFECQGLGPEVCTRSSGAL